MDSRQAAIVLANVRKTFDLHGNSLEVLRDISLTIPEGCFVSIIGPSGCGKSTLLRIVADIVPPDEGSITVLGMSPSQARRQRVLGMVFQQATLLPWLTVEENVALPLRIGGWGDKHILEATPRELLQLVGLEGFNRAHPAQLSGGMQQRVAIARALVSNPRVLLMDEPFGSLDAITRDRMNEELLRIWQRVRRTIIFVTHSITEAVYLSMMVVVMSPRPAQIRQVVDIDLPYPRRPSMKDDSKFTMYCSALRRLLEEF